MRRTLPPLAFAAGVFLLSNAALAADAAPPETLLAGTRWMEIKDFVTVDTIPPERMLLLRLCTIADIAFVVEGGKLTKYDRAGLSGKSMPIAFGRVEAEPAPDGAIHVRLRSGDNSAGATEDYRIDAGGEIMHLQANGVNAAAYMKCRMRS